MAGIVYCECTRNMPYYDWSHAPECPLYVRLEPASEPEHIEVAPGQQDGLTEDQIISQLYAEISQLRGALTQAREQLKEAFVRGAKWWEWHETGATMWSGDEHLANGEAEIRYPPRAGLASSQPGKET